MLGHQSNHGLDGGTVLNLKPILPRRPSVGWTFAHDVLLYHFKNSTEENTQKPTQTQTHKVLLLNHQRLMHNLQMQNELITHAIKVDPCMTIHSCSLNSYSS